MPDAFKGRNSTSMRWMASLLLATSTITTSHAFTQPVEVDAVIASGKQDFSELSAAQQGRIRSHLDRSSPFGKTLSFFYIPKSEASLSFLSADFLERLYQWSAAGSEANCYYASLFATGGLGLPERFVDLPEYEAIVTGPDYREVSKEGTLLPGDLIRLKRARGNMELHSVVYIGRLRGTQNYGLVITKNGPADGPYLVMALTDMSRLYPSAFISGVYRRARH